MQNTEDYFEKEARILDLESALTKMKKNYFQIIQMRYFDNLSFKEIALKLHISENTAKVRCFRAIEKLKDIYTLI